MEDIRICPLCGQAQHPGKCPKQPKGQWWCGVCLVTHPAPLADGTRVADPYLLAAGIRRTSKWCVRCGTPICAEHADMTTPYRKSRPSCRAPDCRARSERELERLIAVLEVYVPDFRTAGPPRCSVCALPSWRRNLCVRHYTHVRQGRSELQVERIRPRHKEPVATLKAYPPKVLRLEAQKMAEEAGLSLSAWVVEIMRFVVEEKVKVNLWLKPTVFRE